MIWTFEQIIMTCVQSVNISILTFFIHLYSFHPVCLACVPLPFPLPLPVSFMCVMCHISSQDALREMESGRCNQMVRHHNDTAHSYSNLRLTQYSKLIEDVNMLLFEQPIRFKWLSAHLNTRGDQGLEFVWGGQGQRSKGSRWMDGGWFVPFDWD